MKKALVVGATGQLGTAVVKKLLARGVPVRALVRCPEQAPRFQALGADVVIGDLTKPATLVLACTGIHTVLATANAALPSRRTDTFEAVERQGYRNLIQAAYDAGVGRFVYTSVPLTRHEQLSPFFQCKRETEDRLRQSGLDHVIFRAGIFMDVAFAMMGSSVPVRETDSATVLRPYRFAARHFQRVKDNIERKRVALVPGDGAVRHSFICIDDMASFLASAAFGGPSGIHSVGGPEALSFLEVVRLYEQILGISLQVRRAPAWVFRLAIPLL